MTTPQEANLYSELAEALGCDCMDSHAARLSRAIRANAAFTAQKQKAADDWVATQEGRKAQQQEVNSKSRLKRLAVQRPAQPCIGNDPLCPCQDGLACHYKDAGKTKAFPIQE
jgi:hypothetical protein